MAYSPSSRTVQEVKRAVTRQFGDESGVQLEDADLFMWINDAQDEIVRRNKISKAVSAAPSVVGQDTYTFPSLNILQVEAIHYDGELLQNLSFPQAQQDVINGGTVASNTGIPFVWYEWAGSFKLFPVPEAIKTIQLFYTVRPTRIASLTDVLSVPDKYYQDVVRYVLQQAYEMDEDWSAAQAKQQQFNDSLNEQGEDERTAANMTYSVITLID